MLFCDMLKGYERDFGCPARVRIKTKKELSRLIDDNNGVKPCFLSVSYYKLNSPFLAFIPFDFDGSRERVLKDTNKLEKEFLENDIPYRIKFSGSKGTHGVIPLKFNKENPRFISPMTLQDVHMHFVKKLKLETFDYHLRGNINALLRIPGTFHEKTKDPCIILREKKGEINIDVLCERLGVKKFKYSFPNNYSPNEKVHPYPCLEYFIKVPNPLNYCRVAFVIYKFKLGKTRDEIFEELSELDWVDWKQEKTEYHIRKIFEKNYSMPCCQTVDDYGLCFGCKYDDRRILKKIFRGK